MKTRFVPILMLILALCAALCSSELIPALGTAAAVLVSAMLTGIVLSAIRKGLTKSATLPAAAIISASSAGMVTMLMFAFVYFLSKRMNIAFTLAAAVIISVLSGIAGSCTEQSYMKKILRNSVIFSLLIIIVAVIRELIGDGTLAGIKVPIISSYNISVLSRISGGMMVLAVILASVRKILPQDINGALQAEGLGAEVRIRVCNKAVPKGFMGIPVIVLAAGLLFMVFFAFI